MTHLRSLADGPTFNASNKVPSIKGTCTKVFCLCRRQCWAHNVDGPGLPRSIARPNGAAGELHIRSGRGGCCIALQSCMDAVCSLAWTPCDQAVRLQSGHTSAACLGCGLQLALILPYVRVGEWITGSPRVELKPVGITDLFKQGSGGKVFIKTAPVALPNLRTFSVLPLHCLNHLCYHPARTTSRQRGASIVGCVLLQICCGRWAARCWRGR